MHNMRFISRFFLSFLLFLVISVLFTRLSFAQTTYPSQQSQQNIVNTSLAPGVPNTIKTLTQSVFFELFSALSCQLAGYDPDAKNGQCLTPDPISGKLGYTSNNAGLIGVTGYLINQTSYPSVHFQDSIAYLKTNFHGAGDHAYAATTGTGFDSISPLLGVWSGFRNVVYLMFILVFVFVGFAIMLRLKIDPRTVMSVQNQLPKIIINLILVTFSFAIAGLLIDLMWVATFLGINLMGSVDPKLNVSQSTSKLLENPIGYFNDTLQIVQTSGAVGRSLQQVVSAQFGTNPATIGMAPPDQAGDPCEGKTWGDLLACRAGQAKDAVGSFLWQGLLNFVISWGLGIIGTVIAFIVILIAMIKVWWALLQAYLYILLDIILAPFQIFAGLVPGTKAGFGAWMKHLLANLSAFPTTVIVLLLGKVLIDALNNTGAASAMFLPPLIGDPNALAGSGALGAQSNPLGVIIGFVVVLITPKIVNITKDAIGAADFKYASSVFENIGAGQQFAGGVAGQSFKPLTRERDTLTGKEEGALRTAVRKIPGVSRMMGYTQKPK